MLGKLGTMVDRTHRELFADDTDRIAATYHAWRGEPDTGPTRTVAGFCASAIRSRSLNATSSLLPGVMWGGGSRDDGEPIEQKLTRLTSELFAAFEENDRLQEEVRAALRRLHA